MPQTNCTFFAILFVALSCCDKDLFCLSHWVPVSNKLFICCLENAKMFLKIIRNTKKGIKITKKVQNVPKRAKSTKKMQHVWTFLAPFFKTYTNFICHNDSSQQTKNLFVAVTQCDKQNKSLLQGLSATNITEKKYPISLCHVTNKLKKNQKQTSF